MTLEHAVLELDADVDQDGVQETGVFEFVGDLELNQRTVVDHLITSRGSMLNSIVTSLPGWLGANDVRQKRAGFYIDLGGGAHTFEANARGWQPSQTGLYTWGDPNEAKGSKANATDQDPWTQMHCLNEYIRQGEHDSRDEKARLRVGEYSDGTYAADGSTGLYDDWLHVTVNNFNFNRNADDPLAFDVSISLAETEDLTGVIDIITQGEY